MLQNRFDFYKHCANNRSRKNGTRCQKGCSKINCKIKRRNKQENSHLLCVYKCYLFLSLCMFFSESHNLPSTSNNEADIWERRAHESSIQFFFSECQNYPSMILSRFVSSPSPSVSQHLYLHSLSLSSFTLRLHFRLEWESCD